MGAGGSTEADLAVPLGGYQFGGNRRSELSLEGFRGEWWGRWRHHSEKGGWETYNDEDLRLVAMNYTRLGFDSTTQKINRRGEYRSNTSLTH